MSRVKKKDDGKRKISTGIRMDASLHEKLQKLAEAENRTVSNYIENILLDHIESLKTKK